MNCEQIRDLFSGYHESSLKQVMQKTVAQHLYACPDCRQDYTEFTKVFDLLGRVPEVVTPTKLHSLIMARVIESSQGPGRTPGWWETVWVRTWGVPIPARALATAAALLTVFTIVNGFIPIKPMMQQSGIGQMPVVRLSPKATEGAVSRANYGLSVSVVSSTDVLDSYDIRLHSSAKTGVKFVMTPLTNTGKTLQKALLRGEVTSGSTKSVSYHAPANGSEAVTVDWNCDGKNYKRYVFLPASADPSCSSKALPFSGTDGTMLDTLKAISQCYGAVVIASGNMTVLSRSQAMENAIPDDVFYSTLTPSGFTWRDIGNGVYLVEPKT